MTAYAINPPNTPLVNSKGIVTPEWYRYLVRNKAQGDGLTDATVITFDSATSVFPNSRRLRVTTGDLTETDGGGDVTLGLADSGVTANTYGEPTKLVILAIDAKGRVTSASEVELNSDNVTEGSTNLFFTQARARASVSGASGISYNSGTGAFTLDQSFTRGLLSGASGVTYNSGTGVVTLDDSYARNLLSGGAGINYNAGTGVIDTTGFSGGPAVYTTFTFVNGICTAAS